MLVKESELETIAKAGIKSIKQVEMYTKWLPLTVGKSGADILCALSSDEIMNSFNNDKNTKAVEKKAAKRKRNKLS